MENNVFEHSVAGIVDYELVVVAAALAVGQIVSIPKKNTDSIADLVFDFLEADWPLGFAVDLTPVIQFFARLEFRESSFLVLE